MHYYQRGRASITGLGLWSGEIIENERLVVVATTRLVRSLLFLIEVCISRSNALAENQSSLAPPDTFG